MTTEEIRAELDRFAGLPDSHVKAQGLETLAERARAAADRALEARVLLSLGYAYEYASEREKLPVVVTRLVQLLDQHPAQLGGASHAIYWMLKWMTGGLYDNPAVPLEVVYRWLGEFEGRYRQAGFSPRPVLAFRSRLARHLGDNDAGSAFMEQAIAAPRDQMSDCKACEQHGFGAWREDLDDDAGALEHWAPVLEGALTCQEEPHRVLAMAMLPLLRTGQADAARGAFLRGYPMVRRNISLMSYVARYAEFCALTGNEARGLEILADHADWLHDTQVDADTRMGFLGGICVLLRRLGAIGHGGLSAGASTVGDLLPGLEAEAREIAARYDARNGTTTIGGQLARRLAQEPLLGFLPLGLATRLPSTMTPVSAPASVSASVPAAGDIPAGGLDELIAHARELAAIRHPGTARAWAAVTATGQELPDDVAAQAARSAAGELMRTDPAAAVTRLADVAARFGALGDTDRELEALASAVVAAELAGTPEAAPVTMADVAARAEVALAAGALTPRNYLNVKLAGPMTAAHRLDSGASGDPARIQAAAVELEEVRVLAERHGQRYHEGRCHDLLARMSSLRGDSDGMAAHLTAAREAFLGAGQPWFAAYPEIGLADHALRAGNARAAEKLSRDALAHGAGELGPVPTAQASSLLVAALGGLEGREADLADAALAAAARWDEISEPDTLHNTFIAARAYAALGRHGEASALFAQAMPKVGVPYTDPPVVAMARDAYGRSLRETGQHEEAASQFLEAARLLQDDPRNTGPHAMLAAMAAEELQSAGQVEAALPAFLKAAELFEVLGAIPSRARALRSAAWLEYQADDAGTDDGTDPPGAARMRSVLTELEALAGTGDAAIAEEADHTRKQLAAMLRPLDSTG